ncbi:MAG TPA: class II aldolase/adducin family protein [Acidobacteriota bacterium]|nr:class II aldolase/adducin family protein [Acidobacteriota bacterium]
MTPSDEKPPGRPPGGHPENGPGRRGPGGSGKGAAAARRRAVRIALCHELIRAGTVLERRSMVVATEGNLSARFDRTSVVITRKGRRKGELTPRDFVEIALVEPEDSLARDAASTEHRLHLAAYGAREDVEAVVHAHPIALTAFGLRGELPNFTTFDEARAFIGTLALIPYHPSGSEALANAVGLALMGEGPGRRATPPGVPAGAPPGAPNLLLLRNHGAVAVGETVDQALSRLEIAEHLASTLLLSERTRP